MNTLVTAFYSGAALVGLPSVAGTVFCAIYAAVRYNTPKQDYMTVRNPDAILIVLVGMARVIQFFTKTVGALGKWVVRGLAIASAVGLMLAATMYFTAKGLEAQQSWARVTAAITSGAGLLIAGVAFLSMRGFLRLVSLALVAVCGRVLFLLWQGSGI